MKEWLLEKYGHLPRHHVPPEYRAMLEGAQRARDRRELAAGMGQPDWADLPPDATTARLTRATRYFTGAQCSRGHVAPRWTSTGHCTRCSAPVTSQETEVWADRFAQVAARMLETGRVCHWRGGRIVETSQKVRWPESVEAACAKAARLTAKDGRVRCVINGAAGMVVRLVVQGS